MKCKLCLFTCSRMLRVTKLTRLSSTRIKSTTAKRPWDQKVTAVQEWMQWNPRKDALEALDEKEKNAKEKTQKTSQATPGAAGLLDFFRDPTMWGDPETLLTCVTGNPWTPQMLRALNFKQLHEVSDISDGCMIIILTVF